MLPYLKVVQSPTKKYTVAFRGLNYGEGTQDGEFSETYNLSTDQYPCLTQRAERIKAGQYTSPSTLHAKGSLLVIDGTDVYYGDKKVGEVTEGKKQTATIGNYIVIFPDKKYYKVPTEDDKDGEFKEMEVTYAEGGLEFTASEIKRTKFAFNEGQEVTISGSSIEGNNKTAIVKSASDYKLTFEDDTFAETVESGEVSIKVEEATYKRVNLTFTTSTISGSNASFPFNKGDVVTISGASTSANNKANIVIKEATPTELTFEDNTFKAEEGASGRNITITRKGVEYKASGLTFSTSSIDKSGEFTFSKGDSVTITGCSVAENNKEAEMIVRGVTEDTITFDYNSFTETT